VELTRDQLTRTIDLTRFSTHGELDANPTLTPADRVRIPRAERLVSIAGTVAFPGVYDLLAGEGIDDLIRFAGGLTGDERDSRLSVMRGRPVPQVLELAPAQRRTFRLRDGDRVEAAPATRTERMILVQGALFGEPGGEQPRPVPDQQVVVLLPYASGMTVLQVLEQLGGPTPLARAQRSSVLRAATGTRVPVDVAALWEYRDPSLDLVLDPGDQLHVPMQDLRIYVAGEVNVPTAVPYQPSLTIGDYVRAAGGLTGAGDTNFTVIDTDHGRSRGTLFTQPGPGSTIIANRNAWEGTKHVLGELAIVAGFTVVVWDLVFKVYDRVTQ
jgi:protein involved in polysaccharide export with SLBB domain